MATSPQTRLSLLIRVRDVNDQAAWAEFVELYAPLLFRYVRWQGLQECDAADVTQDVLRKALRRMPEFEYDRKRGRFRGWLHTVVANEVRDYFAARHSSTRGSGDSAVRATLEQTAAPIADDEAAWNRDYRQRVFEWAAQRVRKHFQDATWQAFWQTAVEGRPPAEVAREVGLSLGAIYVAKSRVLARLRDEVQRELDENFEEIEKAV